MIFHDISERKELEVRLRQAQKMEAVGQLAGGIAHDFNNLLSVILGHCSLLQEEASPEGGNHESLAQIAHAAQRAANWTRQLRDAWSLSVCGGMDTGFWRLPPASKPLCSGAGRPMKSLYC